MQKKGVGGGRAGEETMREQENVQNQTCEGIDHKFW